MVSRAGIDGVPGQLAYSTAKAAIIGLTRSAASALVSYNTTCNCIAPTAATRMLDGMDIARELFDQTGRWPSEVAEGSELDPANIAPLVLYLASPHAGNVSGRTFGARGLLYTLFSQPQEMRSLVVDADHWDLAMLFDQFPRTLGDGLVPEFSYYLDDIRGPLRMHPRVGTSYKWPTAIGEHRPVRP